MLIDCEGVTNKIVNNWGKEKYIRCEIIFIHKSVTYFAIILRDKKKCKEELAENNSIKMLCKVHRVCHKKCIYQYVHNHMCNYIIAENFVYVCVSVTER